MIERSFRQALADLLTAYGVERLSVIDLRWDPDTEEGDALNLRVQTRHPVLFMSDADPNLRVHGGEFKVMDNAPPL